MAVRQMSAFRLSKKLIAHNNLWWLRDVVSSSLFAAVSDNGDVNGVNAHALFASFAYGVRPFALLV